MQWQQESLQRLLQCERARALRRQPAKCRCAGHARRWTNSATGAWHSSTPRRPCLCCECAHRGRLRGRRGRGNRRLDGRRGGGAQTAAAARAAATTAAPAALAPAPTATAAITGGGAPHWRAGYTRRCAAATTRRDPYACAMRAAGDIDDITAATAAAARDLNRLSLPAESATPQSRRRGWCARGTRLHPSRRRYVRRNCRIRAPQRAALWSPSEATRRAACGGYRAGCATVAFCAAACDGRVGLAYQCSIARPSGRSRPFGGQAKSTEPRLNAVECGA